MSALGKGLRQYGRFFWWASATASVAQTNAHLSCEVVNFGPATWRHARSGLGGHFEPIKPGVFKAKLTPGHGE